MCQPFELISVAAPEPMSHCSLDSQLRQTLEGTSNGLQEKRFCDPRELLSDELEINACLPWLLSAFNNGTFLA